MYQIRIVGFILLTSLMIGCSPSVPLENHQADYNAKKFITNNNKSNIYIYRNETLSERVTVTIDEKIIGDTGPKTFLKVTINPGKHTISSLAENVSKVTLNTKPGHNYYIWQENKMGISMTHTKLHIVSEIDGKKGVRECKLVTEYKDKNIKL